MVERGGRVLAPINAVIRPASVSLEAGALVWREGAGKPEPVPTDLFDRFRALRDADDERIAAFARRYGVLRLKADDGLPVSSAPRALPVQAQRGDIYPVPTLREPLEKWRGYATQVQAILNVASRLREESEPRHSDVALMQAGPIHVAPAEGPRTRAALRAEVAQIVRAYLAAGDVRPGLTWGGIEPAPQMEFRGGLFGAIALGLLQAVSGKPRIQFCENCGQDYEPKRAPRPHEHHFCPACRKKGIRQLWHMRKRRAEPRRKGGRS